MRQMIPLFAMAFALVLATMGMLWAATSRAEGNEFIASLVEKEGEVMYAALAAATSVAADKVGQLDYWEAVVEASSETSDPIATFLKLMESAEWSHLAIEMWADRYIRVNLIGMYEDIDLAYANQTSL